MPSYKCNCCSKYLNLNGSMVTLGDSPVNIEEFGVSEDGYVSTSFTPDLKFKLGADYRFIAQSFVLLHDTSGNVYYFGPYSADTTGITWSTDKFCKCGCDCGPSCTTCICNCGCGCPGGSLPQTTAPSPVPEAVAEAEPVPEAVAEAAPEPEAVAEAEPVPEPVTEAAPEPEAVTEAEPVPEPVTVAEAEPEAEVDDVPVTRSAALIEEALNAQAADTGAPTPAAPADGVDEA